jgi:hypothetical protein
MMTRRNAMPEPRLPTAYARRSDGRIYVNSAYLPAQEPIEPASTWYALYSREAERFCTDPKEQKRVGLHLVGSDHRIYVPGNMVGNIRRRRAFHGAPPSDELTALLIEEIHRVASEVVHQSLRELRALGRGI